MKNPLDQASGRLTAATPLMLGMALFTLTACESITGVAPKNTPRVEIELSVIVDDAFAEPLVDVDDDSPLFAAVRRAVRDKADLGLRFYPTPSELYGEQDQRPDYLMTVEVERLNFKFEHEQVEGENEAPRIESTVEKVRVSVNVSIEHRRENGPALSVAAASASSDVSAETKKELIDAGDGYLLAYGEKTLRVLEQDILSAVRSAVDRALKSMRTPIDREFAPHADPAASPAASPAANQG